MVAMKAQTGVVISPSPVGRDVVSTTIVPRPAAGLVTVLPQCLSYGTIAAVRVTHGLSPVRRLATSSGSLLELARTCLVLNQHICSVQWSRWDMFSPV